MTPQDENAYIGGPPLWCPQYDEIHISCCFTWDIERVNKLAKQWYQFGKVLIGGPAISGVNGEFEVGKYLKQGVTITSRGCPHQCPWCFVPKREGQIKELPIKLGNVVQDNNLLACSKGHIHKVFEMLRNQHRIEFAGGLEAARITSDIVEGLRGLAIRHIWVSYDHPGAKKGLQNAVEKLRAYFRRDQIRCYVLIGYKGDTLEEAEARLREAWEIGTLPFAMRYRTPEPRWQGTYLYSDREWNLLTRKWSRPAIIKSMMATKPPV